MMRAPLRSPAENVFLSEMVSEDKYDILFGESESCVDQIIENAGRNYVESIFAALESEGWVTKKEKPDLYKAYNAFMEMNIDEAYFGKSKELLEIEKQIHVVRAKFGNNKYMGSYNCDPATQQLNKLFEKVFGFECFSINFIRSSVYNAYTVPVSYKYDTGAFANPNKMKKLTFVDEKGLKFVKDNKLCVICNVSTGLFFDTNVFTDAEVLAVILHEIGHNFAEALDPKVAVNSLTFVYIQTLLDIINIINGHMDDVQKEGRFNALDKLGKQLDQLLYDNCKPIMAIYNVGQGILGLVRDGLIDFATLMNIMNPFKGLFNAIFNKLVKLVIKPTGYRNEKIADRFVTMYGYGPELTSALSKLESGDNGVFALKCIQAVPVLSNLLSFGPAMVNIVLNAFDEHPSWAERLEDQIRALEFELSRADLDPKMKKEIQSQINQVEKLKDEVIKSGQDANGIITDPTYIKKWWFSKFADGDLKHKLMIGDLNKDLDASVNSLRKNKLESATDGGLLDDESSDDIIDELMDDEYDDIF